MCEKKDSNLQGYLYVLMLGQILHGFGGQTLYGLGIIFLDANVPTRSSPVYQGIFYILVIPSYGHCTFCV